VGTHPINLHAISNFNQDMQNHLVKVKLHSIKTLKIIWTQTKDFCLVDISHEFHTLCSILWDLHCSLALPRNINDGLCKAEKL
jgi:hypothetical protein